MPSLRLPFNSKDNDSVVLQDIRALLYILARAQLAIDPLDKDEARTRLRDLEKMWWK